MSYTHQRQIEAAGPASCGLLVILGVATALLQIAPRTSATRESPSLRIGLRQKRGLTSSNNRQRSLQKFREQDNGSQIQVYLSKIGCIPSGLSSRQACFGPRMRIQCSQYKRSPLTALDLYRLPAAKSSIKVVRGIHGDSSFPERILRLRIHSQFHLLCPYTYNAAGGSQSTEARWNDLGHSRHSIGTRS